MRTRRIQIASATPTTTPGFENGNRQIVVRSTGAASSVRTGQTVYRLRCNACKHVYGVPGIDIKDRLCPACQGGAPAEPLRDEQRGPSLFD